MISQHPVWANPTLRTISALMVLLGALACSFGPYVSLLAVHSFDLGNNGYAAILVASTALSVSASLYVGIRADQTADRRRLALQACLLMLAGVAFMTVAPGPVAFVLAHAVLLPLGSTLFGQLFAQAQLAAAAYPVQARDTIMATIRALFAVPFVVVLPLWSVALTAGVPILTVYPFALLLTGAMTALTWRHWPRVAIGGSDRPSGLTFAAALRELANAPLALRVLALGAVNAGGTMYMALLGLVLIPDVGRSASDVALYAGLIAGLEVPFMLAVPRLAARMARTDLILIGTAIYAIHVVGLPLLAGSDWLWLMILPAAIGGAITLTLPIAYLQDLLAERPGTGAALMALQRVIGDILAAVCFVVGTGLSGYAAAAILGAMITLAGAFALRHADRA
jgi:MFS transporter, SET family, sugar efflux transporter